MPNPWDIKLVSSLTENEMLSYVDHLQMMRTMEHVEHVDRAVEYVVEHWRHMRTSGVAQPSRYSCTLPTARASGVQSQPFVPELGTMPPTGPMNLESYHSVEIRVYPWMDEDVVRYTAREQILEQTQPARY